MRKRARRRGVGVAVFALWALFLAASGALFAASGSDALSNTLLERAQNDLARIRPLVEQGTLPKTRLAEAEAHLADAQDEVVLAETLYGQVRLQDMTEEQASAMLAAASRRVARQTQIVQERQKLLDSGIIARSEFAGFEQELEERRRVRELAENRARLLDDLRKMAETEQRLENAARQPSAVAMNIMVRYNGNGTFNLSDLTTISGEFERKFHHPLPVSALGQTMVHRTMGLDHRNRVDVALNPDQPEGLWLRQLLERLKIPYLAFRGAIVGAATAPHIHIGPGSTRLVLAVR